MRVVAGTARGRRLAAPPGDRVRPTSDRVREAVFNALTSLDVLAGAEVLDLFAGTGALGIEALSRGAAAATFVEADQRALAVLRQNLEATGVADRATVHAGDALAFARHRAPTRPWDIVFCDPPYRFDRWEELLGLLRAGLVVVESGREREPVPAWVLERRRRYGSTVVDFLVPEAPERTVGEARPGCPAVGAGGHAGDEPAPDEE
jgi:16S rRNA (guanine966-N2)-methyltransferase